MSWDIIRTLGNGIITKIDYSGITQSECPGITQIEYYGIQFNIISQIEFCRQVQYLREQYIHFQHFCGTTSLLNSKTCQSGVTFPCIPNMGVSDTRPHGLQDQPGHQRESDPALLLARTYKKAEPICSSRIL